MAIDEHREDWTEEVLERVAEAQGEYQRTVEEGVVCVAGSAREDRAPALRAPFPRRRNLVSHPRVERLGPSRSNGDPSSLYDVLAALAEDAQVTYDPKAWGSRDPHGAAIQARHDEKRKNELAGRGYLTDAELQERRLTGVES